MTTWLSFCSARSPREGRRTLPPRPVTWYFQMKEGNVIEAIAFFNTRDLEEFWTCHYHETEPSN